MNRLAKLSFDLNPDEKNMQIGAQSVLESPVDKIKKTVDSHQVMINQINMNYKNMQANQNLLINSVSEVSTMINEVIKDQDEINANFVKMINDVAKVDQDNLLLVVEQVTVLARKVEEINKQLEAE